MGKLITEAELDAWQAVAQNAVAEGAAYDISGGYGGSVIVDVALTSETAHTGTKVRVQTSPEASGDENWADVPGGDGFVGPLGTANSEPSTANPLAQGATTGTVASTTGYDADGTRWIFIKDATIGNSELLLLESHVAATSITWRDGTARAHQNTAVFYNIAQRYIIPFPWEHKRLRVVYDNTYDSDGSTVAVHSRVALVTSL